MKAVFVTYCSRDKRKDEGDIFAIERYISNRIMKVYESSKIVLADFMILSGEFGLLNYDDTIPYYDHLFVMEEVEDYIKKVTKQLMEKNIKKIVFFTESLKDDPNLKPYQISIFKACKNLNIEFMMSEMSKEINN